MSSQSQIKQIAFTLAIFCSPLYGCASSPDARLYILESMTDDATPARTDAGSVFVAPVVLPDYLRRDEIVFRSGGHRIDVAEYDRWAEPLDRNITSVITANLSTRFGAEKVVDYYANFSAKPDTTVRVRILEFGSATEGRVVLEAIWELARSGGAEVLLARKIAVPVEGSDGINNNNVDATVRAMSAALNQLSEHIADSIKPTGAR